MNITISVVDGIHGRPAEGIAVSVVPSPTDSPSGVRGCTNEQGQFRYAGQMPAAMDPDTYRIEIESSRYFTLTGVVSWCRGVELTLGSAGRDDEYLVTAVITPYTQMTYCVRTRCG